MAEVVAGQEICLYGSDGHIWPSCVPPQLKPASESRP